MNIIGISGFYHDSAASIIIDGKIIAAAQEERFTRIKHDPSFPVKSIKYLLKETNLKLCQIDYIIFYDKPLLKFERILETHISMAPYGFKTFSMAIPIWLREKLFLKTILFQEFKKIDPSFNKNKLKFSEHHLSHAASAFYPSNFNEAIILTIDGVGEWTTTSVAIGNKNKIEIKKEIHFPHSLGLLYSAFTYYCGFKVNSGEYKLMGLAPYGKPIYENLIFDKLIDVKEDGSFRLNLDYFSYPVGLKMINKKFEKLFGKPTRLIDNDKIDQFHMNVAASIQLVIEKILIKMVKNLQNDFKIKNLCLAGGVALNCVANGKILRNKYFDKLWIQPASGDAGGAIGAALAFWYNELNSNRISNNIDQMQGSYLGPKFEDKQIKDELKKNEAIFKQFNYKEMINFVSKELANNKVVGWFQGRMEFGPRALGNRSILGNPMSQHTQKNLNLKIKYRESFRPFAPAILLEETSKWFDLDVESPYMLLVADIKESLKIPMNKKEIKLFGIDKLNIKRSKVPAITHVDYSARIQTVNKKTNKKFYDLINSFYKLTNCPILVNTSFNVRNEPIVCTPEDAFRCFMGTEMDILVINNFVLEKEKQTKNNHKNYYKSFQLD